MAHQRIGVLVFFIGAFCLSIDSFAVLHERSTRPLEEERETIESRDVNAKLDLERADRTRKTMQKLGSDLDVAESALRILLGKPAEGTFSRFMRRDDAKLDAAVMLLNWEQRHPGYLEGKHGATDWAQYNGVLELFRELSARRQFFYRE